MKSGTRTRRINPHRGQKPQKTIEVNCVECNVTIDMVAELDGEPTEVVGCPNCETIFNRLSGKILGNNGA